MIAIITTLLYGLDLVSIELDANQTDLGQTSRRVNRQKTLDGGIAVSDFGSTEADRTLVLVWDSVSTTDNTVATMVQENSQLRVAVDGKLYRVAPESFETNRSRSTLTLLVLEQLA